MKTHYQPLKVKNRLEILDFLRGFALLGILMVNLPLMNAPFTTEIGEFALWVDPVNKFFGNFIKFFFTGSFYPLFSILFGIGFYFFLKKFDDLRKPIVPVFRLRLLWLLFFGILHVVLLWFGDILIIYALMGFVLILFRKKTNKSLFIWAIFLILLPVLLFGALALLISFAMSVPETAEMLQSGFDETYVILTDLTRKALETYPNGTFIEIMQMRLNEYQFVLNSLLMFLPNVLAFFLVGVILGKKRVFVDLESNKRFFRNVLIFLLPLAIAGKLIYVYSSQFVSYATIDSNMVLYMASSSIGGGAMALVYISIIALAFRKSINGFFVQAISKTGRMALTNYLMQSIICTTLFFSYGLGLYGKVNIWQGIIIVLAVYTVEVVWSHYWLKYFRFGPMEWLWRSLTYRKFQKMKVAD